MGYEWMEWEACAVRVGRPFASDPSFVMAPAAPRLAAGYFYLRTLLDISGNPCCCSCCCCCCCFHFLLPSFFKWSSLPSFAAPHGPVGQGPGSKSTLGHSLVDSFIESQMKTWQPSKTQYNPVEPSKTQ